MTNLSAARPLLPGAVLGIVAPSAGHSASFPRRTERALDHLRERGHELVVSPVIGLGSSSEPVAAEQRASELNRILLDPRVDAVVATIGGESSQDLLSLLDWEGFSKDPKLLIGYSDITVLQLARWTRLAQSSIVGPMLLPQLGEIDGSPGKTWERTMAIGAHGAVGEVDLPDVVVVESLAWDLEDDAPRGLGPRENPTCWAEGEARGTLVPCNLSSLIRLLGTAWMPDLRGAILVVEESSDVQPRHALGNLVQLANAGVFGDLAAMVVGGMPSFSQPATLQARNLMDRHVPGPVVWGFAFGHDDPSPPLPLGVAGRVDVRPSRTRLFIEQSCVRSP